MEGTLQAVDPFAVGASAGVAGTQRDQLRAAQVGVDDFLRRHDPIGAAGKAEFVVHRRLVGASQDNTGQNQNVSRRLPRVQVCVGNRTSGRILNQGRGREDYCLLFVGVCP